MNREIKKRKPTQKQQTNEWCREEIASAEGSHIHNAFSGPRLLSLGFGAQSVSSPEDPEEYRAQHRNRPSWPHPWCLVRSLTQRSLKLS